MPEPIKIEISGEIAQVATALSKVVESISNASVKHRESMSPAAKDEDDHIRFQAYWDFRAVLHFCKLVGDPLPWPPPAKT